MMVRLFSWLLMFRLSIIYVLSDILVSVSTCYTVTHTYLLASISDASTFGA